MCVFAGGFEGCGRGFGEDGGADGVLGEGMLPAQRSGGAGGGEGTTGKTKNIHLLPQKFFLNKYFP